jgi:hypothetical protein
MESVKVDPAWDCSTETGIAAVIEHDEEKFSAPKGFFSFKSDVDADGNRNGWWSIDFNGSFHRHCWRVSYRKDGARLAYYNLGAKKWEDYTAQLQALPGYDQNFPLDLYAREFLGAPTLQYSSAGPALPRENTPLISSEPTLKDSWIALMKYLGVARFAKIIAVVLIVIFILILLAVLFKIIDLFK